MGNKEFIRGVILGVSVSAAVVLGAYLGYAFAVADRDFVIRDKATIQKLETLEALIEKEYLEEEDEEQMAEGLYTGLIAGLGDVYSRYYTAEEYRSISASNEGTYVGIGVVIQANTEGGVQIVECYEGGPAELAGLIVGDIISAIDDTDIMEMEITDVAALLQDEEKETALLTVHRKGVEEVLQIEVEITDVELPSVFAEMLDEQVGYIRITEFSGMTPQQYHTAFSDLTEQGMEMLVIDLRDNPGGVMSSVCEVLNEILPEGLIVYTEDKYGNRQEEYADVEQVLEMPLAVLVNESSASAAEIFAGAVQDHGVGTIVGTTTYGKGVVQNLHKLTDGSAVKLTSARYYTPNGNSIDQVGIQPDVEVKLDAALLNKEEYSHEEDNQLQKALEIVKEEK